MENNIDQQLLHKLTLLRENEKLFVQTGEEKRASRQLVVHVGKEFIRYTQVD